MPSTTSKLTLMLFVDALRPDYLRHAPYLRDLQGKSATGSFRECFGFVQHQAYYGGLTPEEYGFTNFYSFDPANSPFSAARAATPTRSIRAAWKDIPECRKFVNATAKDRMTPYARTYGNSLGIPLEYARYFDVAEKYAPWSARMSYRSCFKIMDELGLAWFQCLWPDTNRLPDHSDGGIVKHVLDSVRPDHRLACVHIQELDGLGHAFGPNSSEVRKGIEKTDDHCRQLIETLRLRFNDLNVVLFGDHGMVNVIRTLDVAAELSRTGLRFGIDYAYFLDSTIARFWFYHRSARTVVEAALEKLSSGRILKEQDLDRYKIRGCDARNGELYFLVDPGVLIFPNFFQSAGEPIRGMHGYDLDCADNLAFYLMHDPSRPEWNGSSVGTVDSTALFPTILDLVGLEPVHYTALRTPTVGAKRGECRVTLNQHAGAEQFVQDQLGEIVREIVHRTGVPEAVVLTGSFGRGEGGVVSEADGHLRPINDYDIIVVDRRDLREKLAGLGDELARKLNIDFVDIGYSDGSWSGLPITIFNYDLKYGSQTIFGDTTVLDRIPAYASADLPVDEIVKLLLNRSAGLLSASRADYYFCDRRPEGRAHQFLVNQIAKAWIAIGDWHLFRWRGYDSSYALRCERFSSLARGAGLNPDMIDKIVQAYRFKCQPNYTAYADIAAEMAVLAPLIESALIESINLNFEGHTRDLDTAMSLYLESSALADQAPMIAYLTEHQPELAARLKPSAPAGVLLAHAIYSVIPTLILSAVQTGRAEHGYEQTRKKIGTFIELPVGPSFNAQSWEEMRALVVRFWFALCH